MAIASNIKPSEHNEKVQVHLTGVAETLLITLHARASDAECAAPMLGDSYAVAVKDRLDHDWSRTRMNAAYNAFTAMRGKAFDEKTQSFIHRHAADGPLTVLHLACGLDSRAKRVEWGSAASRDLKWIDVDLPDVVQLRRKVMPPTDFDTAVDGNRRDYSLVAADLMEDDWLSVVPKDRKAIIVAEGLLPYLPPDAVQRLLLNLVHHIQEGGEIVFDFTTWVAVQMQAFLLVVRRTGAVIHWSLDNPAELEKWDPRLKLIDWERIIDLPDGQKTAGFAWWWMNTMSWMPLARDALRIGRFSF
jgi:O-methyltransferase involved in polyketide biosynthesis